LSLSLWDAWSDDTGLNRGRFTVMFNVE
jgi:hypothetical protein